MRFIFHCLCLYFILIACSFADQLIIEPDMGREPIVSAIENAHQSIKLVMYGFTDAQILDALTQQKQNGKNIQVILEKSPYKADDENKNTIATFNEQHINWHASLPAFKLVHQKTLIIDDRQIIVMTFNFTNSTFQKERNFALILDNAADSTAIDDLFVADWNNKTFNSQNDHLIISPDNSRDKIIGLISSAQQSIDIYAQNVSDYKTIGALAKAARHGIKIRLLTSLPLKQKAQQYLEQAGVQINYDKKYLIHAKVFIIDHHMALLGSINLTRASLDDNRELSVISTNTNIVNKLTNIFQSDWSNLPTPHVTKTNFLNKASLNNPQINLRTAIRELRYVKRIAHHLYKMT